MALTLETVRHPSSRRGVTGHARTTVVFDATHGPVGNFIIFPLVGRVWLQFFTCWCTADLAGATATIGVGEAAGDTDAILPITTATVVDTGEWFFETSGTAADIATPTQSLVGGASVSQINKMVGSDITVTIGTADITGGTLIFDAVYFPLTDTGRLN